MTSLGRQFEYTFFKDFFFDFLLLVIEVVGLIGKLLGTLNGLYELQKGKYWPFLMVIDGNETLWQLPYEIAQEFCWFSGCNGL